MTTDKQIAANRLNAKSSTGPKTEHGKRRSRRNAFRHGLTAETVIDIHEDPIAYRALERSINADYRPRTHFELELIARLVSLLWRLRRAAAIESGLFDIHADPRRARRVANCSLPTEQKSKVVYDLISFTSGSRSDFEQQNHESNNTYKSGRRADEFARAKLLRSSLTRSFMRLASDGRVLERLSRYETNLWRQTAHTLVLLNSINCGTNLHSADATYSPLSDLSRRRRRMRWPPFAPFA